LQGGPLSHGADGGGPYRGKRLLDLVLLALVAVPAGAVGILCAIAARLTSRGPVFFRQERIGLNGRPFRVFKFRTMQPTAEQRSLFPDPELITPAGRWLRRFSLDELPQLINVARGEMSIVGPRPTLPYQVERYTERQRRRLSVRPGLTGIAQVRGRNAVAWAERIEHDLEYVDGQSVKLDLTILLHTARALLSGPGVEGHPRDDPIAIPDEDLAPKD
jgi:lipopolysaccharide/colanic/teichoic acid biosynthesis glycosyltransferase